MVLYSAKVGGQRRNRPSISISGGSSDTSSRSLDHAGSRISQKRFSRRSCAISWRERREPSSRPASCAVEPMSAAAQARSEEHTSELQSLMRISYAVFCLKKKIHNITTNNQIVQKRITTHNT